MAPSGPKKAWRLWRHCCCRYGLFPLLIVPIVTLGCLLTLYSSTGCKFVEIDIGFTPTNEEGWDATAPYYFGLLYYYNASMEHDNNYQDTFHSGCVEYSDNFYENLISGDRTFKMTGIMTLISCVSSALAMVVAWLVVISPLPAGFFWPAVLLPSTLVAFISEGSKFLLFDSALCRNSIWYRGSNPVPERAESCAMGETSWFACAATILHFWALVCVCIRAPERRILSQTFGSADSSRLDKNVQEATSDDNDIDDDSCHDGFLELEEGSNELRLVEIDTSKKQATNSDMIEVSLGLTPIGTNPSGDSPTCCDLKATKGIDFAADTRSLTPTRRSSPLSPVDCLIEGFDVATDLSQINVCRTMAGSPTPKALEDGSVQRTETNMIQKEKSASKLDPPTSTSMTGPHDDDDDDDQAVPEEGAIEVIDIPEITIAPSIIMSPAMRNAEDQRQQQQQQQSI